MIFNFEPSKPMPQAPAIRKQPLREHGAIIIDGIQQGSTHRCPHCGGHFIVAAGGTLAEAKTTLGELARPKIHCWKCGRLTCGRPCCDPSIACAPLEAQLDNAEGHPDPRYADAIRELKDKGLSIL